MERITMSIEDGLMKEFDRLIRDRGYTSRSEAMRDLLRRELEARRSSREAGGYCIASLSYVFNQHVRRLAERLTAAQHEHHDLIVSSMHVHLDHDNCLETVVLKGTTQTVRAFANALQAERGVRHVQLNVVSVQRGNAHARAADHHHGHLHLIPRN